MNSLSQREKRALSLLKAHGAEYSLSNMRDALCIVDNCRKVNESVKAKAHLGCYSLAKQDLSKYTPVLVCGISASAEPDALMRWLLAQPNALRAQGKG